MAPEACNQFRRGSLIPRPDVPKHTLLIAIQIHISAAFQDDLLAGERTTTDFDFKSILATHSVISYEDVNFVFRD